MNFIAILLGTIIAISIVLGVVFLILYKKFKDFTSSIGISGGELKEMLKKSEVDSKYRIKSVAGMTEILIPKITSDFPNFSESELYNKVETSLNLIFSSLTNGRVSDKKELVLLRSNLEEIINNLNESKTTLVYEDVSFHKHVIDEYKKDHGVLKIKVQSSLEYYYEEKKDGKIKVAKTEWKKQSSYTTEFIYVYNPDEYESTQTTIGIRCPNCGAPVKRLGNKSCEYCSSGLEDINLKSWFIITYKEDKR